MNTQNTISFTLEAYRELVVEKGTHEVRTKEDSPVRILCTDRKARTAPPYSIVGLVSEGEDVEWYESYQRNGQYNECPSPKDLIIVPKPPKSLGWSVVALGKNGDKAISRLFDTKEELLQVAERDNNTLLSEPFEIFEKPKAS